VGKIDLATPPPTAANKACLGLNFPVVIPCIAKLDIPALKAAPINPDPPSVAKPGAKAPIA
jgi:hypothetical protein